MRAAAAAIGLAFCMRVGAEASHDQLEIPEPMVFDLVHGLCTEIDDDDADCSAGFRFIYARPGGTH